MTVAFGFGAIGYYTKFSAEVKGGFWTEVGFGCPLYCLIGYC